ncbi:MAG: restriction endonuclease subunit S, partial [Planctomycetota bacterium]|nr:restriction endonuclease subunit S [Planctomycetota bacterium]
MKKSKGTLTPKLRFPEFRDKPGWEEVPLEQVAEQVTTKKLDGSIARVLTNSAEHGVLDQRDYFDKDIANAGNIDGYYIVDLGDFVYNPRKSILAPLGPISRNNIGKGLMSPLYTVFRFTDENTDFYQYYFKSASWHPYLRRVSNMGARHDRMSITTGEFMAMPVPKPPAKEQKKIADCLSSADELIAAEVRKLAGLRDHKRGLMQQLFPRPGETQPRLRFPEFRDEREWEEQKLEKLAKRGSGHTPNKSNPEYYNGGIKWVSLADSKRLDSGLISDTEIEISDQGLKN